ncbi:hypothetical protein L9F63_024069, partial [Diploptera punctata]
ASGLCGSCRLPVLLQTVFFPASRCYDATRSLGTCDISREEHLICDGADELRSYRQNTNESNE